MGLLHLMKGLTIVLVTGPSEQSITEKHGYGARGAAGDTAVERPGRDGEICTKIEFMI